MEAEQEDRTSSVARKTWLNVRTALKKTNVASSQPLLCKTRKAEACPIVPTSQVKKPRQGEVATWLAQGP